MSIRNSPPHSLTLSVRAYRQPMLALQFKSILFGEPHDARHLNAVTNITDRAAILCPRSILYEHRAPLPPRIYKFNFARCEIYDRLPVSLNFQTLQFSPVISHLYIYIYLEIGMGSNWICKCKSSSMDSSAAVILLIRCKRPIACVYNDYEVLFLM